VPTDDEDINYDAIFPSIESYADGKWSSLRQENDLISWAHYAHSACGGLVFPDSGTGDITVHSGEIIFERQCVEININDLRTLDDHLEAIEIGLDALWNMKLPERWN
jgi:hypothetical protein